MNTGQQKSKLGNIIMSAYNDIVYEGEFPLGSLVKFRVAGRVLQDAQDKAPIDGLVSYKAAANDACTDAYAIVTASGGEVFDKFTARYSVLLPVTHYISSELRRSDNLSCMRIKPLSRGFMGYNEYYVPVSISKILLAPSFYQIGDVVQSKITGNIYDLVKLHDLFSNIRDSGGVPTFVGVSRKLINKEGKEFKPDNITVTPWRLDKEFSVIG